MTEDLFKAALLPRIERHESGCWLFTGSINENGYGVLHVSRKAGNRRRYAHRVAYEVFVGPIPTDKRHEIHHKCETPACVNPAHLECLTRSAHARLNEQYARATCPHGHPRTAENTYVHPRTGHRLCRVCTAESARRRRRAKGLKGGSGITWRLRTHCSQGHEYTPENVYLDKAKNARVCLICRRERQRKSRAKR